MYTPPSEFYEPTGSYQFPVPVPSIDPMDGAFVSVQFPEEYTPYILGCLMQLLEPTTWDTDDNTTLGTAIVYANQLIYLFERRTLLQPPGSIQGFGGIIAPDGWLECDGAAVSRTDYADLFAAIDVIWGDGDGSTTFNVPDLRDKTIVGNGHASGFSDRHVGDVGGEEEHTLVTSEMPSHSHTNTPHTHTEISAVATVINGGLEAPAASAVPSAAVTGATGVTIDSTGGDGAHNNMQPFGVAMWIIKT